MSAEEGEELLKSLLKETRTHDVRSVMQRLNVEGRRLTSDYKEAAAEVAEASAEATIAEQRMKVIGKVLEVLERIYEAGRTRVGDSELKGVIRSVMADLKVSPEAVQGLI